MFYLFVAFTAFFIPIPLFFDLRAGSFIVESVVENQVMFESGIPIPIGFMLLSS